MRSIHLIAGALIALVPLTASASTLQMRINGGADGEYFDTDGDGRLVVTEDSTISGFDLVQVTATQKLAPPFNQLLANMTVDHNEAATILVEVTAQFTKPGEATLPGMFGATANDAMQSEWLIRSFVGAEAYDTSETAVLVLDTSAEGVTTPVAVRSMASLNLSSFWITHALQHTGGPDTVAAGNADFAAVVPVPAAGVLLLGALGGLAVVKRRRKA
jgi:hypothetical protein